MEVEMHTSPDASGPSRNLKRARSPPSPTPPDRPTKRQIHNASGAPMTSPVPRHAYPAAPALAPLIMPPMPAPDAAYSAYAAEDWVTQTRGLRIDSPHLAQNPEAAFGRVSDEERVAPGQARIDVTMVDRDVPMDSASPPRGPADNSSAMLGFQADYLYGRPVYSLSPQPQQATHHASRYENTAHPGRQQQQLQIPAIQVHAATPSPVHRDPNASLPPSARRQRFTMGPRADCEKCRMGVKGHWMHVD
ncbi:hypothetical protein CERSUDRAFT_117345 [Gelatoporia subvermispora B]|uniref:Uncharacterized protein n=1 Tax=Ceriporiopsis subvermispora (strain B) TaxID=914234 RepID=M2QBZ0_CERS8|nr:hypothetical protein CERSUDRAFT_117345 [Gelatoporia subvermispora B]